jgi:bacillithiol biosynthesis deacetylase BshB1
MNEFNVDVLCFAAHPDDIELGAGGTVAKLTREGKSVAIVDFTRGELGSRGSKEIRSIEAMNSSKILGIKQRECLGFPDGNLTLNDESVEQAIIMIRKYKPKIVIMNSEFERHPDHESVHKIVRKAMFKSGLIKVETRYNGENQEKHRIRKMYSFMQSYEFRTHPHFYVDITDTFDLKMQSIMAYSSQVYVPGVSSEDGPITRLSRPEFLQEIESRATAHGMLVGFKYAEAFYSVEPIGFRSLSEMVW